MSFPLEPDFAVIKIGDGSSPESFTVLCGIDQVSLNQTVNTNDQFRRDCARPGMTPKRKVRVTGTQWDITGSGVVNTDMIAALNSALGISQTYRIEFGRRDGTDAGEIIGYYIGRAVMTANNQNVSEDGTMEVTLAGEDDIIWTQLVSSDPIANIVATTPVSDTALVYEITLDMPAPAGGVSVNWIVGGTLQAADVDGGVLPSGPTVVVAGQTSAVITVTLDAGAVPGRTLSIALSSGAGYDIGSPSSALGTVDS